MGLEGFRFKPLPDKEMQETASYLIQEFKDASGGLPADFQRRGVQWHIDENPAQDRNKLIVTAKTPTDFDIVTLETSGKDITPSIRYEGRRTTKYACATADPGENTKKAIENTENLLTRLKQGNGK